MALSRRDLLLGIGGGAAGVALTPVPWKLLDDLSIWTQRRHALPIPPKGEVSFAAAACPLCTGGCALRLRRVGARPVSVLPERAHPLATGVCPLGLTLHHLAHHPLRRVAPALRASGELRPATADAALAALTAAVRRATRLGQTLMVVDRRPGRVVSQAWAELAARLPNAALVAPPAEDGTFAALRETLAEPTELGIDLERTRVLLSFGAPVLDGWGRSGRLHATRGQLRVVQVDSWRSPSAALADEWLPVRPGTEGPLALALAQAVGEADPGRLSAELREALVPFAPAQSATRTGVEAARVEALARRLLSEGPAAAIGGGEAGAGPLGRDAERAIALLDVVLGAVGCPGGFLARRPLPDAVGAAPTPLEDVPAGSVGVAILDAADDGRSLPWAALRRTLAPDAVLVSLSAFDHGLAARADLRLPAPAPLEGWDEVLPSPDVVAASYRVSRPLLPAPSEALDPVAVIQRLGSELGLAVDPATHEERLQRRVSALFAAHRGRFASATSALAPADATEAWDALAEGGCWIDEPATATPSARALLPSAAARTRWGQPPAPADAGQLVLLTFASRGCAAETPVSPLLSKLYQESDLRLPASVAALHPRTAERLGVRPGRRVWVESEAGRVLAELRCDETLSVDCLALAAGPVLTALHPGAGLGAEMAGALALVGIDEDGTWRGARVRVREA